MVVILLILGITACGRHSILERLPASDFSLSSKFCLAHFVCSIQNFKLMLKVSRGCQYSVLERLHPAVHSPKHKFLSARYTCSPKNLQLSARELPLGSALLSFHRRTMHGSASIRINALHRRIHRHRCLAKSSSN